MFKQSVHQFLVVLSSDKYSLVKLIPPSLLLISNVIAVLKSWWSKDRMEARHSERDDIFYEIFVCTFCLPLETLKESNRQIYNIS